MGDGDDENVVFAQLVDDAVRESMGGAAARVAAQRMPPLWMSENQADGVPYFGTKVFAEAMPFTVGVTRSISEFGSGQLMPTNRHASSNSAHTSSSENVLVRPSSTARIRASHSTAHIASISASG